MSTFRTISWFLLVTALLCCVSCQFSQQHARTSSYDLPWAGFGSPGPNKIMVEIAGHDPKHPGRYYLDYGANLESVYFSFGGWYSQGGPYDWPPTKVFLTHKDGTRTSYQISKMTKEEKAAVQLKDGDRLDYLTTTF